MIRLFLLTVLWLSAAQALWAQDVAHLIADRIEILPNGTLNLLLRFFLCCPFIIIECFIDVIYRNQSTTIINHTKTQR